MMKPFCYALTPINDGRLFVRDTGSGLVAIVGVVDVPRKLLPEHLLLARLNEKLYLDHLEQEPFAQRVAHPAALWESDVGGLMLSMKFRGAGQQHGRLVDALELGLRESALPHRDVNRYWGIVFGCTRGHLSSVPRDGLYELSADRKPACISTEAFNGWNIHQVLREPLWGPNGQFGLAMSMDPKVYPAFVEQNRRENARSDPLFAKYKALMEEKTPLPLVYTREQLEAHSAASRSTLQELLKAKDDDRGDATHKLGALPRPKN